MKIVYVLDNIPPLLEENSIFLAGGTYREKENYSKSWRLDAIKYFEDLGFEGTLIVPEWKDGVKPKDWTYSRQVSWEKDGMDRSEIILFWIPRDKDDLPCFTTNIEFGHALGTRFKESFTVGFPEGSYKNRYIKERCSQAGIPVLNTLKDLVKHTISLVDVYESKTFVTADTHFGSKRTLELSKRPFEDEFEMDKFTRCNWEGMVDNRDTVIHLGDIGDPSVLLTLPFKKLILLPGNYDTEEILDFVKADPRVEIIENNHEIELPIVGKVKLVHEPEKANDPNAFYLYAHVHKLSMIKRNGLNVGVDCHDFYPMDTETIAFYKNAIQNHYDKNVFMEALGEK